jgi:hypothetical protein
MVQKLIPPLVRVEDGKIEQLLRGAGSFATNSNGWQAGHAKWKKEESWTQLSLHSACLAAADISLIPAAERTHAAVEEACMRRFTNRHYRFSSMEHYLETRRQVIAHLQKFLVDEPCNGTLMARFETFMVYVDELDMELSQRFHLIVMPEENHGDYIVQKLIADDNRESLELYVHMTIVFGMSAFGRLPSRIEALMPISGRRHVWKPDRRQRQQSMDYMRLVKSMLGGVDAEQPAAARITV